MARTAQAIVKRNAIFVKEMKDGHQVYVRRPYDLVEYNWGEEGIKTYLQPHFGQPQSKTLRSEVYDDVRFYSTPPDWDLIGRGSDL
jgi:hypothetical protein